MMADGAQESQIFAPSADTARALRDAFGQFATGVTLVTIATPLGPMGFVANSFTSLSLDPPLILWALAKSSRRYDHFAQATHFAVHILSAGQEDILTRFKTAGAGFQSLPYQCNDDQVPLLDGALARLECRRYGLQDGGDHVIVLGQVQRVACQAGAPLIFAQGKIHPLPQPASTKD